MDERKKDKFPYIVKGFLFLFIRRDTFHLRFSLSDIQ